VADGDGRLDDGSASGDDGAGITRGAACVELEERLAE
jgi:hypothetical protein